MYILKFSEPVGTYLKKIIKAGVKYVCVGVYVYMYVYGGLDKVWS